MQAVGSTQLKLTVNQNLLIEWMFNFVIELTAAISRNSIIGSLLIGLGICGAQNIGESSGNDEARVSQRDLRKQERSWKKMTNEMSQITSGIGSGVGRVARKRISSSCIIEHLQTSFAQTPFWTCPVEQW